MRHHDFSRARRRLFLCAPFAALGVSFAATSCSHLTADTGDGGGAPGSSGGSSGSGSGSGVAASSGGSGSGAPSSGGVDQVVDGAAPDVAKIACMDSTENLAHSPGYVFDANLKMQADGVVAGITSNPALANQMRGTSRGTATAGNYSDIFRTPDDTANGIKGFLFRDGPRGVNLQASQLGINYGAGYSTAYPVPVARAASWDLDLEAKIGADMGDETLASGNTMILAPCVNILRHPAWGRAQETYGEDSFLLGRFGSAYVEGVQQYVPACVKHYAANNIEDGRENQNALIDAQTLHEIYGRHYEMIIQDAGVSCVMAAYNEVNGTKSTQNPVLLTDMLRATFNFQGFVLSDWWAMPPASAAQTAAQAQTNGQAALSAGLDMELPWSYNYSQVESFATTQQLQTAARRIVEQKYRFNVARTGVATQQLGVNALHNVALTTSLNANGITNNDAHVANALTSAEEGMVLLKNDKNTLPINRGSVHSIAVIGAAVGWNLTGTMQTGTVNFATDVRLGDMGSSRVASEPGKSTGPAAGIAQAAGSGITVTSGTSASLADAADFVVVVAGLTAQDEGEEYTGAGDRTDTSGNPNLGLDAKTGGTAQNALIAAVAAKNKPMVVVLEGGSAIDMPWLTSVPAIVMAWYPGMAGGAALGKLLFGDVNFSGKLPITWPKSLSDEPPFNQGGTSGGSTPMDYFLGYRYFDKNGKTPLYALGAGLSYTTFEYTYLGMPCASVTKKGVVDITVGVKNTGTVPGNEVSLLFVAYPSTTHRRSVKELKGFHRTIQPIMPGATVQFTIPLRVQDLKYWDDKTTNSWQVESGPVQVMVGPSSDNLPLKDTMTVQ